MSATPQRTVDVLDVSDPQRWAIVENALREYEALVTANAAEGWHNPTDLAIIQQLRAELNGD